MTDRKPSSHSDDTVWHSVYFWVHVVPKDLSRSHASSHPQLFDTFDTQEIRLAGLTAALHEGSGTVLQSA